MAGHLFQCKEMLMICVAEEANLQNIKVSILKSSYLNLIITGHNFYVAANFCKELGWHVHVACCYEGDEVLSIPLNAHFFDK